MMRKALILLAIVSLILPVVAAAPNFDVNIDRTFTEVSEQQGDTVNIYVDITNKGSDGQQKIECGIYTTEQLQAWGVNTALAIFPLFSGASNVPNCVATEDNVDTVTQTLKYGATTQIIFTPKAPFSYPGTGYRIFCAAFDQCWNEQDNPLVTHRVTDTDLAPFELKSRSDVTPVVSCSDGLLNQDETDTDCGGFCGSCPNYAICKTDSDCQSNYCSPDKRCLSSQEPTPTPEPNPNPAPVDDGRILGLTSLQIVGLAVLAMVIIAVVWVSRK